MVRVLMVRVLMVRVLMVRVLMVRVLGTGCISEHPVTKTHFYMTGGRNEQECVYVCVCVCV